jgi:hypothetical protein
LCAKRAFNMTCLHGSFLYIPAGERTKRKEKGKRKKENPNFTPQLLPFSFSLFPLLA